MEMQGGGLTHVHSKCTAGMHVQCAHTNQWQSAAISK